MQVKSINQLRRKQKEKMSRHTQYVGQLRSELKQKLYKQSYIARRLKMGEAYLSMILSGARTPKNTIQILEKALKIINE